MDEKKLFQAFGRRIRQLRKQRGWSQEQLAEAVSRSRDAISNLERGINGTHIGTAQSIAQALGVTLIDLFEIDLIPVGEREKIQQLNRLSSTLRKYDPETLKRIETLIQTAFPTSASKRPGTRKPTRRPKP